MLLGLDAIAKRSPVPEIRVGLVVTHGKKSAGFTVAGSGVGTAIQRGLADCKGTLEAPFDAVLQIIGMSVSLQDAIEAKRASVSGTMAVVRKLPLLFDLADRRRMHARRRLTRSDRAKDETLKTRTDAPIDEKESPVKKFVLLHYGFEKPTPEIMAAWGKWFEAIKPHTVDMGGFGNGREISKGGTKSLTLGPATPSPASRSSTRQASTTLRRWPRATRTFRAFESTK